jgi:hypothetical protein
MAATETFCATELQLTRFFFAEMLWTSTQRTVRHHPSPIHALTTPKTRSGTVFAAWSSAVDFFAPLLSQAVAAECEGQEDHELEDENVDEDWTPDPLNQVDEEWPPPDPLNQVDEEWPPPDPLNTIDDVPAAPSRKRCASPMFEQVVASGPAQSGSHRRRALRRARKVETQGHDARPAAIRKYVVPSRSTCPLSTRPPYLPPTARMPQKLRTGRRSVAASSVAALLSSSA